MPSLFLLSAGYGAVSQSSGRDVAFRPFGLLNLFPVFQCDMVVGTFFMSFLGGKCFLRKKSWCVRFQHCGYQATDKGKARKVSWYFRHSMLLCSRMFLLCVFHFWTTAVKKAGVLSFAWMLFHNFCCEWQILHLFGMKLNLVTTLLVLNLHSSCVNSFCGWQYLIVRHEIELIDNANLLVRCWAAGLLTTKERITFTVHYQTGVTMRST